MTEPAPPPPIMPTLVQAALKGLCPRCGAPTLFAGWIRFASRCERCGVDFDAFNVGDGPAAFLTLILGTIVTGLAIWLERNAAREGRITPVASADVPPTDEPSA